MRIFDGFGHVALRVNDLETSVGFYNAIGFPEMLRLLDAEGKPWIVYRRISEQLYLNCFRAAIAVRCPIRLGPA